MIIVSIIIPCYNDGKFLADAIESVQAQSFIRHIETIVVDDGSDDHITPEIIRMLSTPNLKKLRVPHGGPAKARNAGIAASQGEYILALDADDTIAPYYVEKAVALLEQKQKLGIVYCQADYFGKKSGPWLLPTYSLKEMLVGNVIFATAMFRKSDWENIGGYREIMHYGLEDYDFWLSLLELGREVYQIPECLFHYRIKNISRTTELQNNIQSLQSSYQAIYEHHKEFYQKHNELYVTALREKLVEYTYAYEHLMISRHKKFFALKKWIKHYPRLERILRKYLHH